MIGLSRRLCATGAALVASSMAAVPALSHPSTHGHEHVVPLAAAGDIVAAAAAVILALSALAVVRGLAARRRQH